MGSYLGIAGLVLFGLSIFVLARADNWSASGAVSLVALTLVLPLAIGFWTLIRPTSPMLQETVVGVADLLPFIVLFALSKSVSGRMKTGNIR